MFRELKISFWGLILILIISIPAGIFIFNLNANKINYIAFIEPGELIQEKYCSSYSEALTIPLLRPYQINQIRLKLKSDFSNSGPSLKGGLTFDYLSNKGVYQLVIGGVAADLALMKEQVSRAVMLISQEEQKSFQDKFAKYQIYCQGKIFPTFRYASNPERAVDVELVNSYSKKFLYLSSLTPFLILYLLFVMNSYLKANINNLIGRP